MRSLNVNWAMITPSVAEVLDPVSTPQLEVLGLGGEAVSERVRLSYFRITKNLINVYGPAECSVVVTVADISSLESESNTIGKGVGSVTWVVDPDYHERLLPIGAIGELLIEGPVVGLGYLNDSEKTATTFIEDPAWLLHGAP